MCGLLQIQTIGGRVFLSTPITIFHFLTLFTPQIITAGKMFPLF